MTKEDDHPGVRVLSRLWWASITAGVLVALACLALFGVFQDWDWFLAFIALAIGATAFSGMFFLSTNLAGIQFETRLRDETVIRGSNVEHVTHVERTGEAGTDKWLARYVFARNLFGGLVVPLLILAGVLAFN